jgi:hypothetical protein
LPVASRQQKAFSCWRLAMHAHRLLCAAYPQKIPPGLSQISLMPGSDRKAFAFARLICKNTNQLGNVLRLLFQSTISAILWRGTQMKKQIAVALCASFIFACAAAGMAEVKEGLWEMKMTTEMKGMPMKMPTTTSQTCITKNDMVPKPLSQGKQAQECKIKEQNVSGDTVTYAMECSDKTGMSGEMSGKMTYTGDTMEGSSTMKITSPAAMEMTIKMSGKYLGACKK